MSPLGVSTGASVPRPHVKISMLHRTKTHLNSFWPLPPTFLVAPRSWSS